VHSDRWNVYLQVADKCRQLCWAHLKRDFRKIVDCGGPSAFVGRRGLRIVKELFAAWHAFQEGQITRRKLSMLIEPLQRRMAKALLDGGLGDDARVAKFAEVAQGRVITFGTSAQAEFRAGAIEEQGIEGAAFDFVSPAGRARLQSPLIGRHNVMNAMAALAAASVWGVGAEEAERVFPTLTPADKRGEVVRFDDGFTVINDSYNSSPTALIALIQLLAATPGYHRRIVAAGEMLELGDSSEELHRECGRSAASLGKIDWIFGVQGYAADFVDAAVKAGHPRERTQLFENSQDAAKFLESFVTRGDLLLLKGSRGTRMERILEAIEARHRRVDVKTVPEALEAGGKGRN